MNIKKQFSILPKNLSASTFPLLILVIIPGIGSGISIPNGGQSTSNITKPNSSFEDIFAKKYTEINVSDLNKFEDGTVVDANLLKESGVISKILDGIVVLGRGEITKKITVKAARVTEGAAKKIEAAGGKVEVI